jgi:hypothetical protein
LGGQRGAAYAVVGGAVSHVSEGYRAMSKLDLYLYMLGSVLLFFWLISLLLG